MKSRIQFLAQFLCFVLIAATLTQCSKEAARGPHVVVTVDGRPFSKEITIKAAAEEKILYLQAVGENNYESVIIQILGFHGSGVYQLEKPNVLTQDNLMIYSPSPSSGLNFWNWGNPAGPGYLEVEYYDPNGTISANFSCRLYDFLEGDSVTVEGKFLDFPVEKKLPDSVSPNFGAATVDGTDFIGYISTEESGEFLVVKSTSGSNQGINVGFKKDIYPGLYDVASFPGTVGMAYLAGNDVYYAETGYLTILDHDRTNHRIRGKFQFNTPEGYVVSDGEFLASY